MFISLYWDIFLCAYQLMCLIVLGIWGFGSVCIALGYIHIREKIDETLSADIFPFLL